MFGQKSRIIRDQQRDIRNMEVQIVQLMQSINKIGKVLEVAEGGDVLIAVQNLKSKYEAHQTLLAGAATVLTKAEEYLKSLKKPAKKKVKKAKK